MGSESVIFFLLCVSLAGCQDVNVGLVAKISTFPYEDSLNKGGLSFETKDGSDLLRRRLLITSNGNVGFNLPDGSMPEAAIHTTGDILAQKGLFLDSIETVALSATTNVSAQTLTASELVNTRLLTADAAAIKEAEVSAKLIAHQLVAHQLEATSISAAEVSVSEAVRTKAIYASELVNATEVVTTSIKSAGIPMDEAWASHPNEICEGQHSTAANAVVNATTGDLCIAACMRVSMCAGVTFYSDHASRAGVDAPCYMALGTCKNVTDDLTPNAAVYHRPPVRVLDMADELLRAKAEVVTVRAEMEALKAQMAAFTEAVSQQMTTFAETLSTLHTVATTGNYNDLGDKPSISSLSGTLAYSSLSSTPSLAQGLTFSGKYESCSVATDRSPLSGCNGLPAVVPLGTSTDRICYLTRARMGDTDYLSELAGCHITDESGFWTLTAAADNDAGWSDGNNHLARCEARCFVLRF